MNKSKDNIYSSRRFPWNQATVSGWLATSIIFTVCAVLCFQLNYGMVLFFVGISDYHQSFSEYFIMQVARNNEMIQNRRIYEIKQMLRDIVQFHVMVKE